METALFGPRGREDAHKWKHGPSSPRPLPTRALFLLKRLARVYIIHKYTVFIPSIDFLLTFSSVLNYFLTLPLILPAIATFALTMLPVWAWVLIALCIVFLIVLVAAIVFLLGRRRSGSLTQKQQQSSSSSKKDLEAGPSSPPQNDDSSSTIKSSFKGDEISIKIPTPSPDELFKPLPAPPRKPRQNSATTLSTNNLTTLIVQARQLSLSPFAAAGSPVPSVEESAASNPV